MFTARICLYNGAHPHCQLQDRQPILTQTPESQPSYGRLIRRNRAFRHLWAGQIVSLTGDWFNLIASAALVASLTQSGAALGALFVVRMLAPFLVSPFAGVVADRYSRKTILIITDVLRCFIVLGYLLVREPGDVWLVYLLTTLQSASQGFFFPASTSILPDITGPQELGIANALVSATWSVMLALGAALGGLVAGVIGVYAAFVIDAGTFVVSALILARMPYRSLLSKRGDASLAAGIRQYIDGLAYLRRHPGIFAIALQKGILGLLVIGFFRSCR